MVISISLVTLTTTWVQGPNLLRNRRFGSSAVQKGVLVCLDRVAVIGVLCFGSLVVPPVSVRMFILNVDSLDMDQSKKSSPPHRRNGVEAMGRDFPELPDFKLTGP